MTTKPDLLPGAEAQRNAYDEFSAAFAEIEKATEATPPAEPAPAAPVATAAEPPAEPAAPAAEPPAAALPEPAPAESAAAPPDASAAPAPADDPAARLAALEAENAALKAAQKAAPPSVAAPEPAAPVEPAAPAAPSPPQWYQFNDDEKAAIETYEKDWGDVAKAESIRRKADIFNAVTYVFAQMRQHIEPKLKEFSEISELMSNQLALTELRREAPDYDNIYDAVGAWVETLPTPFRAGAKYVMENGTTEEVSALIKEYRKAHPAAPASAPAAAAPAAAGGVKQQDAANLSPAAKQAAQRLSVVGSKRSAQRGNAVDPNDFDGAWEEAMREGR